MLWEGDELVAPAPSCHGQDGVSHLPLQWHAEDKGGAKGGGAARSTASCVDVSNDTEAARSSPLAVLLLQAAVRERNRVAQLCADAVALAAAPPVAAAPEDAAAPAPVPAPSLTPVASRKQGSASPVPPAKKLKKSEKAAPKPPSKRIPKKNKAVLQDDASDEDANEDAKEKLLGELEARWDPALLGPGVMDEATRFLGDCGKEKGQVVDVSELTLRQLRDFYKIVTSAGIPRRRSEPLKREEVQFEQWLRFLEAVATEKSRRNTTILSLRKDFVAAANKESKVHAPHHTTPHHTTPHHTTPHHTTPHHTTPHHTTPHHTTPHHTTPHHTTPHHTTPHHTTPHHTTPHHTTPHHTTPHHTTPHHTTLKQTNNNSPGCHGANRTACSKLTSTRSRGTTRRRSARYPQRRWPCILSARSKGSRG